MKKTVTLFAGCAFSLLFSAAVPAQSLPADQPDLVLINRLRDEALNRSRVQDYLTALTDDIGPRLTGSPALAVAANWAQAELRRTGLQNVHTESFAPFGRSWTLQHASLRVTVPAALDVAMIPKAWTPGTNGVQHGAAIVAKIGSEAEFALWAGKLRGKIVLLDEARVMKPHLTADAQRYSDGELNELGHTDPDVEPGTKRPDRQTYLKQQQFRHRLLQFLSEEGVIAVLHVSRGDDGTIFVQGGGSYKKGEAAGPPDLMVSANVYNRLYRLLEKKIPVELDIDVKVSVGEEDPAAAVSVLADIPGSDKKDEIVMLGAHLDSWHGGTGATDNAAGVAAMMEAVRLLKVSGFQPRRTIRIALWGGEEQGLLGSRAYVKQWVADRPVPDDEKELPSWLRSNRQPLQLKALHDKISAYYNLDNGSGRIRGVYAENNVAAKALFDTWLQPFHDLGATTVSLRNTGSTDHVSFDSVGVPGFQFIQDKLDYMSRTHHSNMDVYDKVQKNDLAQAALIIASFVAQTANREQLLPRKPLPPPAPD